MDSKSNGVFDTIETIINSRYESEMERVVKTKNQSDFNHIVIETKNYIIENNILSDSILLTDFISRTLNNLIFKRL
jgi:hypothetical protein